MSSKTPNYNLHKIDLADSPPDITVLNQNFDTIDTKLKEIEESSGDITPEEIGAVAKTGDTMSGNLTFKKAENGEGAIFKNHSSDADYGLVIKDVASDGDYVTLTLQGANNSITFRDNEGNLNMVYGQHNITAGTTDLTAGTSALTTGHIHLVYE